MIRTLEEAQRRIAELELENEQLKEELMLYKNRKMSGRKKHNDKWMEAYQEFAVKFESGMTIMEIVEQGAISRRTAYRYKEYYDECKKRGI